LGVGFGQWPDFGGQYSADGQYSSPLLFPFPFVPLLLLPLLLLPLLLLPLPLLPLLLLPFALLPLLLPGDDDVQ
jgi:hypothetical protein